MERSIFRKLAGGFRRARSLLSRDAMLDSNLLLRNCPEGIVYARDGVVVQVNQALLDSFGCAPAEVLGKPLARFLPIRDRNAWLALLQALREAPPEAFVEAEFNLRRRRGLPARQVITRLSRMNADTEDAERVVVFVADITGLRRSEHALRDHAQRLRQLACQVIDVQEAERRHLARELHDEIGQQLTLLKMSLMQERGDSPDHLQQAAKQVDALTNQVRSLSLDLRPSMLDDLGLVAALRWYVKRTGDVTGLTFDTDMPESFPRLEPDVETAFFRVAQESVNNAVKHSQATCIHLKLRCEGGQASLAISDNGVGFDSNRRHQAAHEGSAGGLLGMEERAALIGAQVTIASRPGHGCTVRMSLSLREQTAPA